jgi:hypothetical protein
LPFKRQYVLHANNTHPHSNSSTSLKKKKEIRRGKLLRSVIAR